MTSRKISFFLMLSTILLWIRPNTPSFPLFSLNRFYSKIEIFKSLLVFWLLYDIFSLLHRFIAFFWRRLSSFLVFFMKIILKNHIFGIHLRIWMVSVVFSLFIQTKIVDIFFICRNQWRELFELFCCFMVLGFGRFLKLEFHFSLKKIIFLL